MSVIDRDSPCSGSAAIASAGPSPIARDHKDSEASARAASTRLNIWTVSSVWNLAMLTVAVVVLIMSVNVLKFPIDFGGDIYLAGTRILHGVNPYDINQLRHEAAAFSAGQLLHPVTSPRWPAPILLLAVPFALLPVHVAAILFMLISTAAVIAALRLLDVRDPVCVLVAMVSAPTVNGILVGNISPLILLGAAAVWRMRSRHLPSAAVTAGVLVAKLFLWPLGLWLLIAKGRRNMLICGVLAALAALIGWMVIGFAGLTTYPEMLVDVARIGEPRGCSLIAFLLYLGFGTGTARFLALTLAFGLLLLAWRLSRRPHCARHAFGLVIIAALTATPVAWNHYMVLLFIPIALISPRFSWLWSLPTLSAFAPEVAAHNYGIRILPILLAQIALTIVLCQPLLRESAARRYWRSIVATAKAAAPS